jgi:hypothetical protein
MVHACLLRVIYHHRKYKGFFIFFVLTQCLRPDKKMARVARVARVANWISYKRKIIYIFF